MRERKENTSGDEVKKTLNRKRKILRYVFLEGKDRGDESQERNLFDIIKIRKSENSASLRSDKAQSS